MPLLTRYALAASARRPPSARLYASVARSSVLPTMTMRIAGLSLKIAILLSSVAFAESLRRELSVLKWIISRIVARDAAEEVGVGFSSAGRDRESRRAL